MFGVSKGVIAGFALASIIFPEPLWGLDGGWRDYRNCRQLLKDNTLCRRMAEETFTRSFPNVTYTWPVCGKDDVAEAILWAAIRDREFVDRYMGQMRRVCR